MSRYRKIHVKIWASPDFLALSAPKPNARDLFFHLLTGPHTTAIPGLFSSGPAALAESIGWPIMSWKRCFHEIETRRMAAADWGAKLVYLPGALAHNTPSNPNAVRSWRDEWKMLPKCALLDRASSEMGAIVEPMGELYASAWGVVLGTVQVNRSPNGSVIGSVNDSPNRLPRTRTYASTTPDSVPVSALGSEGVQGGAAFDGAGAFFEPYMPDHEIHRATKLAFTRATLAASNAIVPPRLWEEDESALDAFWLDAKAHGTTFQDFLTGMSALVAEWIREVKTAPKGGWRPHAFGVWIDGRAAAPYEDDTLPALYVPKAAVPAPVDPGVAARVSAALAGIGGVGIRGTAAGQS